MNENQPLVSGISELSDCIITSYLYSAKLSSWFEWAFISIVTMVFMLENWS